MAAEDGTAADTAAAEAHKPKLLTLVIPVRDGRLLLGKKLRGFGQGYYNGFGGKVEKGETVYAAALRELHEEAGIRATSMEHVGELKFVWDDNPQPWEVHVFRVTAWEGRPHDTEEMEVLWFEPSLIPYKHMWADDRYWYPLFLGNKRFKGTFHFKDTYTLVDHTLEEVDSLQLPAEPLE